MRFDHSASNIAITKAMCDAQIHRGPDDEGYYANGPLSMGIRRLAIIDLNKGLYPLRNEEGGIHLVFNGEMYGFQKLRNDLEERGHRFRSKTDAETVVHSYEEWGTKCLEKMNGMFAFALWDELKQQLWIVRDPFGIKPLYYYQNSRFLLFASEIKPLLTHPEILTGPNESIIRDYIRKELVDSGQETFFDGINRLAPAHHMMIQPNGDVRQEEYWAPTVSRDLDGEIHDEEIKTTRRLFLEAVERQLVSDVPVGTCLSGGIDSSSIVCAVKKAYPEGTISTGQRIKTFSAVFPGDAIDETQYARKVCETTRAEYNPVMPTATELWDDLPTLVKCQEEPFGSSSIYAQWRVMKRAKERGITVMLDGQGGDELFAGYPFYYMYYLLTLMQNRKYQAMLMEALRSLDLTRPFLNRYLKALPSIIHYAISLTVKSSRPPPGKMVAVPVRRSVDNLGTILEKDTTKISLPCLLRYEDKNSMWHSIEARVPFLDRPFFEYIGALPLDRKLRNGWTKYVFRLAMTGILPDKIRLRRSKVGFETPEKRWIWELRDRLIQFFSDPNLMATKFYNAEALKKLLNKRALTNSETSLIWRALNLEMWYREFLARRNRSL